MFLFGMLLVIYAAVLYGMCPICALYVPYMLLVIYAAVLYGTSRHTYANHNLCMALTMRLTRTARKVET